MLLRQELEQTILRCQSSLAGDRNGDESRILLDGALRSLFYVTTAKISRRPESTRGTNFLWYTSPAPAISFLRNFS